MSTVVVNALLFPYPSHLIHAHFLGATAAGEAEFVGLVGFAAFAEDFAWTSEGVGFKVGDGFGEEEDTGADYVTWGEPVAVAGEEGGDDGRLAHFGSPTNFVGAISAECSIISTALLTASVTEYKSILVL